MADRYWNPAGAANWADANVWAHEDGGTADAATPTLDDDVYFTSTNVNNCTIGATANCKSLSFTGGTGYTGILAGSSVLLNIYGSMTFSSGMTNNFTGNIYFRATTTGFTITTATKTLGGTINFVGTGGGWTLQDNMTLNTKNFTISTGTVDLNGKTLAGVNSFVFSESSARTLTCGAASVTAKDGNFSGTNGTFNPDTSTFTFSNTTNFTFNGGDRTFNNVVLTVSNGTITLTGGQTYANLTFNGGAYISDGCTLGANQTVTGTLTINGNSTTNRFILYSDTIGTARTLTVNDAVTGQYFDLQGITGAGTASWDISGVTGGSGDALGNSGITFTTADTETWNNVDGGSYSTAANWTGAVTSRVPLCQDAVNLGLATMNASKTITVDVRNMGTDVTFNGVANTPTIAVASPVSIYGSLNLTGMGSFSGAGTFNFFTRSAGSTLTSGGKTFPGAFVLKAVGGKLTAQDATIITTQFQNWAGTFDANDFDVTLRDYTDAAGSVTRNITMGNGTWTVNRTSASVWSVSGTNSTVTSEGSTIVISDTGASAKTFTTSNQTYNDLSITAGGAGTVDFIGTCTFGDFTINAPKSVRFTAATTTTFTGNFTATGDAVNGITLGSITAASHTLSKSSGTVSVEYCTISRSTAQGGASWEAYTTDGNTDGGNNSGWKFSAQDNAAMFLLFP